MPLTRLSLSNPAAVCVGIALIVLMGILAFTRLPIQLFPDTERPQVNIATFWRSAFSLLPNTCGNTMLARIPRITITRATTTGGSALKGDWF